MALVPRGLEAYPTQEKMMDIQPSALNELFVLYPLIIPGWVSPVKPADIAHGGIPKALYDGQTKGLECLVDPWTELQMRSWTMAADDRVDLYCNGNLVPGAGQTVKPGEETLRQRLYLPHGNLMHGVNRLHYVVTRVGGDSEPSRDLLVLYHLRPADNLDLVIPPDVIANGVDAARAASGVEFGFTYANRRNHDRIEFLLGDIQVRFDVPDGTAPITHTLFTDTFQKVGDNLSAVVEFYVLDQLSNRVKSPEKPLDIHLAVVVTVPTLTNVRDANDKEIPNTGISNSTTLKLTGKASKGKEVEIYDGSGPSAVPKGKATADATTGVWELTITVPVGARRLYAKSLYHSGNVYSNVRTLTIETGLTLDPPVPAANPVDPLAYPLGMPIQVAYLASSFGDHAQLIQLGPLPQTFPKLPLDSNHQANFNLDARFLGAWHGKTAEFVWALIRGNEEIARSGPLVLNVNRIADGDSRLPTPIIVGQTGAELDVNKLVAGDTLSIAPWLLQVAGRYVWLRLSGFNNSGAPVFIDVIDGVPHNETQGLTRSIGQALVDWFKTLKQGTAATITFRVNYSGLRDLLTAVAFPVRTYTVKAAPDIPELIVDTSLLSLKGENYTFRFAVAVYTGDDAVGSAESRAGKGGVGTITYESLNPLVASVDSKGVVRSEGNGRTTIVVRDAAGQEKSFEVVTANVTIAEWTSRLTLANGRAYVSQVGGQMIANSLTDRRVQIASRRVASFNIAIGVATPPPYLGQITIAKKVGGAVQFSVSTLYADGTTLFKYWINKPAS
jgi:hypothetical protein